MLGAHPAPRKKRAVDIALPSINGPDALKQASARILTAVAAGGLTPREGEAETKLLDHNLRLLEPNELAARIVALEQTNPAERQGRWMTVRG